MEFKKLKRAEDISLEELLELSNTGYFTGEHLKQTFILFYRAILSLDKRLSELGKAKDDL